MNIPNLEKADTRDKLQQLLAQDVRKIIITTVFKFGEASGALNERSNIIALVDEAHRTQEGDLGRKMREALPNAFLFGLTGTPINRADRNTFYAFGADEDEKGYPAATTRPNDYIRSAVKIEAGAKSALDPHTLATVRPYVADDLQRLDLAVSNVVTVEAERTFWDKIIILHGLRQWHDRRGVLRHAGQRVSRHYYDVHQLLRHEQARQWLGNHSLATDCAQHARLFFGSPDLGLTTAAHGSFTLAPSPDMREALRADYAAMAGMVFGEIPTLDAVLSSVEEVEQALNG